MQLDNVTAFGLTQVVVSQLLTCTGHAVVGAGIDGRDAFGCQDAVTVASTTGTCTGTDVDAGYQCTLTGGSKGCTVALPGHDCVYAATGLVLDSAQTIPYGAALTFEMDCALWNVTGGFNEGRMQWTGDYRVHGGDLTIYMDSAQTILHGAELTVMVEVPNCLPTDANLTTGRFETSKAGLTVMGTGGDTRARALSVASDDTVRLQRNAGFLGRRRCVLLKHCLSLRCCRCRR